MVNLRSMVLVGHEEVPMEFLAFLDPAAGGSALGRLLPRVQKDSGIGVEVVRLLGGISRERLGARSGERTPSCCWCPVLRAASRLLRSR